jgi:hypothetical protein
MWVRFRSPVRDVTYSHGVCSDSAGACRKSTRIAALPFVHPGRNEQCPASTSPAKSLRLPAVPAGFTRLPLTRPLADPGREYRAPDKGRSAVGPRRPATGYGCAILRPHRHVRGVSRSMSIARLRRTLPSASSASTNTPVLRIRGRRHQLSVDCAVRSFSWRRSRGTFARTVPRERPGFLGGSLRSALGSQRLSG